MTAVYSNLLTTDKRFDASAKGEQPFGATRTPRLYGAAAAARNSVAYWFAKAVTIVSLRAFIRIF